MKAGRVADAKRVLTSLDSAKPANSEVQFLLGMIAMSEKNYDGAIAQFRRILAREPDVARVRLELARAFFLNADYDNAERQFRYARSGDLSDAAKENIDHYLGAIRVARQWSENLSLAIVPDTNINAGPSITTVGLYGLPFELSQDARQQSGIGTMLDAGGEWSPPISDSVRLRVGGQASDTDYPGHGEFNDLTAAGYAGPRFLAGAWEISPLVTGFERWYANRFYNEGVGGSLQTIYYYTPTLGFSGVIGAQQVTYAPPAGQSGPAISGALNVFYTVDPSSAVSAGISASRQDATFGVFSYTAKQIQLGYNRDLFDGWSVSPQTSFATVDYDSPLAAFGVARRDRLWVAQVALLNRRLDFYGFTPRIAYIYTHNSSDITLYAYNRNQIQIGLTRDF